MTSHDVCHDCGKARVTTAGTTPNFCSVITQDGQSRLFCGSCKRRRGLAYQFDPREWDEIVDAESLCSKHGKPTLSEYGSYCEDCEPADDDGESYRGTEAAAVALDRLRR